MFIRDLADVVVRPLYALWAHAVWSVFVNTGAVFGSRDLDDR